MIGTAAFLDCSSLINVTIQEGVGRIEKDAFRNCTSLTSLRLPGSVSTIGEAAFMDCSAVTSITMLEGITEIGEHAFRNCGSLVSVEIPESVTSIGYAAFYDCRKLETVYYGGTQTQWGAINIGSYNPKLTDATKYYISDGTEANYSEMVSGILQSGDGWQIKWEVLYNNIVSGVKTDAFLKIYIEGVNTTDTAIPLYCLYPERENIFTMPWLTDFQKSDFEKIYIQGSIDNPFEIVSSQFSGYNKVQTVQLDFVETLQSNAFSDCISLETVIFDGWLDYIGNGAFRNDSSLHKLYNRSKINKFETIGDEAFMNTGLTSFDFHSALKTIGNRAFIGSQLTSVEIGPNVTSIGDNAFPNNVGFVICCYRISAAYVYAWENEIRYNLMDNDLNKMLDAYSSPSSTYDNNLSILAAQLSYATYSAGNTSDADVRELLYEYGFQSRNIYSNFGGYNETFSGSLQFLIATKPFEGDLNGNTDIMVIVAQGSKNAYELFQDATSGTGTHSVNGYATYDLVWDFYHDILEGKENDDVLGIKDIIIPGKNYKVFLTGHSLGGAAVNLVAATLTTDYFGKQNVYCYSFGAIDSIPSGSLISAGYENIHNVYNTYDTFSPTQFGGWLPSGMGSMYGKFGHLDLFAYDWRSDADRSKADAVQIIDHINHDMDKYLTAVQNEYVQKHN